MKKYLMIFIALVSLVFVGCDDSDIAPGGTATEEMAGQWDVQVSVVNPDGSVTGGDPLGVGTFTVNTYNTAGNSESEMWLDSGNSFWKFKLKVDLNYSQLTFAAGSRDYDLAGSGKAVVTNGKILKNAALTSHNSPNDSIVFDIQFSDDTDKLTYRVSGQRYTGFLD